MMDDLMDYHPFVFITLLIGAILSVIVSIAYVANREQCYSTTAAMKLDSTFGLWTGCMVRDPNGEFMPFDIYTARYIGEKNTVEFLK